MVEDALLWKQFKTTATILVGMVLQCPLLYAIIVGCGGQVGPWVSYLSIWVAKIGITALGLMLGVVILL